MGLIFNRDNRSRQEKLEYCKQDIIDHNYLISIELATGVHGADEIIAGSMIGETGKLIAMSKYGKDIWSETTIQLFERGLVLHYNGGEWLYSDILDIKLFPSGLTSSEILVMTTSGNLKFKQDSIFAEAVVDVMNSLRNYYLENKERLDKEFEMEQNPPQEKESNADRLINLGEMYEKGLISDEEFATMKKDIIGNVAEINNQDSKKFCMNCGAELVENAKFCTECGNRIDK